MKAEQPPVITIDGPSGSGKGTLGHRLAHHLGWHFLDSGALYRVLALAAIQNEVNAMDVDGLAALATHLDVTFPTAENPGHEEARIYLGNQDVTRAIREPLVSEMASKVSAIPQVRTALLQRQRDFRQPPGLVTDGRDMGTVVFPDATLKVFLEASLQQRANRRYHQLNSQGIHVNLAEIKANLAERDTRDQKRVVAPLQPAPDAVTIDTTELSVDQVFLNVLDLLKKGAVQDQSSSSA